MLSTSRWERTDVGESLRGDRRTGDSLTGARDLVHFKPCSQPYFVFMLTPTDRYIGLLSPEVVRGVRAESSTRAVLVLLQAITHN